MNRREFIGGAAATLAAGCVDMRPAARDIADGCGYSFDPQVGLRLPGRGLAEPVRFWVVADSHLNLRDDRDAQYAEGSKWISGEWGGKITCREAFLKILGEAKKAKPEGVGFRPLGDRVLVLFDQADWEVQGGLLVKAGLTGVGYRMDGKVVAVGPRVPADVGVGSTVYADPRTAADVLKIGRTRYHLLRYGELLAVATTEKNDND